MSNLKTKFESKLTKVVKTVAKNGRSIYTASFENGTDHVIRTSNNDYVAVAQVELGHYDYATQTTSVGPDTEFLFSHKATPSMRSFQQDHLVAIVPVEVVK